MSLSDHCLPVELHFSAFSTGESDVIRLKIEFDLCGAFLYLFFDLSNIINACKQNNSLKSERITVQLHNYVCNVTSDFVFITV